MKAIFAFNSRSNCQNLSMHGSTILKVFSSLRINKYAAKTYKFYLVITMVINQVWLAVWKF